MTGETVKQAMQPLLLTASILGLGVYSAKKFHLSVLYNLTIWIAYCYLYYYVVIMFKVVVNVISTIYFLTTILITVVFVIMSLYQDKVHIRYFESTESVDEELKKFLNNFFVFERVQILKRIEE